MWKRFGSVRNGIKEGDILEVSKKRSDKTNKMQQSLERSLREKIRTKNRRTWMRKERVTYPDKESKTE